jgi:hypothetical protein
VKKLERGDAGPYRYYNTQFMTTTRRTLLFDGAA